VQIKLKGKGANLRFPIPSAPITAQIRNVTTGQCWTKTFPNHFYDGVKFKAVP